MPCDSMKRSYGDLGVFQKPKPALFIPSGSCQSASAASLVTMAPPLQRRDSRASVWPPGAGGSNAVGGREWPPPREGRAGVRDGAAKDVRWGTEGGEHPQCYTGGRLAEQGAHRCGYPSCRVAARNRRTRRARPLRPLLPRVGRCGRATRSRADHLLPRLLHRPRSVRCLPATWKRAGAKERTDADTPPVASPKGTGQRGEQA